MTRAAGHHRQIATMLAWEFWACGWAWILSAPLLAMSLPCLIFVAISWRDPDISTWGSRRPISISSLLDVTHHAGSKRAVRGGKATAPLHAARLEFLDRFHAHGMRHGYGIRSVRHHGAELERTIRCRLARIGTQPAGRCPGRLVPCDVVVDVQFNRPAGPRVRREPLRCWGSPLSCGDRPTNRGWILSPTWAIGTF